MSSFPNNYIFDVLHEDIGKKYTPIKIQDKTFIQTCFKQMQASQNQDLHYYPKYQKRQKIKKNTKRKRVYQVTSKWNQTDIMKYWKFYIKLTIEMPYISISWKSWKIDSIFIRMSKALEKKPEQCKSFDERMKHSYAKKQIDLLDIAYVKLQEFAEFDEETYGLLEKYVQVCNTKSIHMKLLDKVLQKTQKNLHQLKTMTEITFQQQEGSQ